MSSAPNDFNVDEIISSIPDVKEISGSIAKGSNDKAEGPRSEVQRVGRGEMSVSAVARLMGIATTTELKTVEGKIDLLTTKLALLSTKLEKAISELESVAKGSDVDRIEVQLSKIIQSLNDKE